MAPGDNVQTVGMHRPHPGCNQREEVGRAAEPQGEAQGLQAGQPGFRPQLSQFLTCDVDKLLPWRRGPSENWCPVIMCSRDPWAEHVVGATQAPGRAGSTPHAGFNCLWRDPLLLHSDLTWGCRDIAETL